MRRHRKSRRPGNGLRQLLFYFVSTVVFTMGIGLYLHFNAVSQINEVTAPAAPIRYEERQVKTVSILPTSVQITRTQHGNYLRGDEPTILIYHTHTTEAYTQTQDNAYVETSAWRTSDRDKSVVAVGEALAELLRREYGYCVIHDTTNHEPPSLSTSYERSEQTMRAYLEKYPTLQLFIDVHRDAYTVTGSPTTDVASPYGDQTCRVMCVVGKGTSYNTDKPYFVDNLALAERLTDHLLAMDERLARPVRIKDGRYNQHISRGCLLLEVGHNANTLEQAMAVLPYLADAIALTVSETEPSASEPPELRMWVPTTFDKP